MKRFKKPLATMLTLILLLSNNISTMAQSRDGPNDNFAMYWRPIEESTSDRFQRNDEIPQFRDVRSDCLHGCPPPRNERTQPPYEYHRRQGFSRDERRRGRRTQRTLGYEQGYEVPNWIVEIQPYLELDELQYRQAIVAERDWYNEWEYDVIITIRDYENNLITFQTPKYVVFHEELVSILSHHVREVVPAFVEHITMSVQLASLGQLASAYPVILGAPPMSLQAFAGFHDAPEPPIYFYPPFHGHAGNTNAQGHQRINLRRYGFHFGSLSLEAICIDPGRAGPFQGINYNLMSTAPQFSNLLNLHPHNNPAALQGVMGADVENMYFMRAALISQGLAPNTQFFRDGQPFDPQAAVEPLQDIFNQNPPADIPRIIFGDGNPYTRYAASTPGQDIDETISTSTSRFGNHGGESASSQPLPVYVTVTGDADARIYYNGLQATGRVFVQNTGNTRVVIPEPRPLEGCVTIEFVGAYNDFAGPHMLHSTNAMGQRLVFYVPSIEGSFKVCWDYIGPCPPTAEEGGCPTPPTRSCPDGSTITAVWTQREGVPEAAWCDPDNGCWEWPQCPENGNGNGPPPNGPPPDDCPECCPECPREDHHDAPIEPFFNVTRQRVRWNNIPVAFAETKMGEMHNQFGQSSGALNLNRASEHFEAMMG